ncbi:helix-turn-helix domain-containing protein [Hymenobacter rubripertinctus]|uniref:helix-turn-helix domain-containing protein n=1 Tax=Hymenobacter rubripertinctus TaxID=2029981 RepID=UPI0015FFCDEA|nr:helix-turn-helix domain-containing protein [Hymenobacter rubripertinctus]
MGRPAIPSTSLVRVVRTHFGLTLEALAAYLRVSVGLVSHLEAGRRALSGPLLLRLSHLARHVPEVPAALTEAETIARLTPPSAPLLEARLDYCQHHAGRLRRELRAFADQLRLAGHWQQALPTLLPAAPDATAAAWLDRRQQQTAADLDADSSAHYHLLRARLLALEAETEALKQLLALLPD